MALLAVVRLPQQFAQGVRSVDNELHRTVYCAVGRPIWPRCSELPASSQAWPSLGGPRTERTIPSKPSFGQQPKAIPMLSIKRGSLRRLYHGVKSALAIGRASFCFSSVPFLGRETLHWASFWRSVPSCFSPACERAADASYRLGRARDYEPKIRSRGVTACGVAYCSPVISH